MAKKLTALDREWQFKAKKMIHPSYGVPLRKEMTRILEHHEAETALRYMADANNGDPDIEYFVDLVHLCATRKLRSPSGPSRKEFSRIAKVLSFARDDYYWTSENAHEKSESGQSARAVLGEMIQYYSILAEGRPGRPLSPAWGIIINLLSLLEDRYRRPVYATIAALLQATFPTQAWDVSTVKTYVSRNFPRAKVSKTPTK